MSILRKWAEKARREGINGRLIEQILHDDHFTENVCEAMEIIASGKNSPDQHAVPVTERGCVTGGMSAPHSVSLEESTEPDSETGADVSDSPETICDAGEGGTGVSNEAETPMMDEITESGEGSSDDLSVEGNHKAGSGPSSFAIRLREATTSDFPDFTGDDSVIRREMIKGYSYGQSNWRKLVRVIPLSNMKTNTRLRRSDTDKYLEVPESGEVPMGEFSSYKVTYTPMKYERGLNFTWEMLINDDTGAFRNIAVELGRSAQNTVSDFVIGLIRDNDVIYDGYELFHPVHGNIGTDALSEESLSEAITAMKYQTSENGSPLSIRPGYLVVPPELEFTAKKLIRSALVPGSGDNDINVLKGIVDVLVEPLLDDPDNWYLVARPQSVATVEIGFLGGRETPEVFMKEDFDRDCVEYKGRIVFGGAVMDYRGFYGSLVG